MVVEAGNTVDERQLGVFDLAAQHYGVDIGTVREIIRTPEIRRVPDSPPSVGGVINLRGRVIRVIDLRRRLGLTVTDATSGSRVVVVEIGGDGIGVIVDAVAEVRRIPVDFIEGASSLITTSDSFYINGIAKIDAELAVFELVERAHPIGVVRGAGESRGEPLVEVRLRRGHIERGRVDDDGEEVAILDAQEVVPEEAADGRCCRGRLAARRPPGVEPRAEREVAGARAGVDTIVGGAELRPDRLFNSTTRRPPPPVPPGPG